MLTGSREGSLDFSGSQVGHSNHATNAIALAASAPESAIGTRCPWRRRRKPRRPGWAASSVMRM
jgi:hypothetical protein